MKNPIKRLFTHKPNESGTGHGVIHAHTELIARKIVDGKYTDERRVVHDKMVTDVFVAELVDTLQSSVAAFSLYKYHHSGIGVGAEAAANTALGTPKEDARVVGTQIEGATANIYKSVATITYTGTWAITEHGLFNTAGAGGPPVVGGVLMDRTVFAAINVVSGNQIEYTFTISFSSGG